MPVKFRSRMSSIRHFDRSARAVDAVTQRVDSAELAPCQRIAAELAR